MLHQPHQHYQPLPWGIHSHPLHFHVQRDLEAKTSVGFFFLTKYLRLEYLMQEKPRKFSLVLHIQEPTQL